MKTNTLILILLIIIASVSNGFHSNAQEKDSTVFFIVEDMPEFPGGDVALLKYLTKQVKYPVLAQNNDIQGKVYVTFVVGKTGKVSDVKIARGVDPSIDKEAMRVVNSLPKWKPGKQRGKPVNVSYTLSFNFLLNGKGGKIDVQIPPPLIEK